MPRVRARHLKTKLAAANRHARRDAIRGALGPEVVRGVEEAHASSWLPIEWDVLTARTFHQVLGPGEHAALQASVMREAFGGPLLGPMVRAALAVLDLRPPRWARWIVRGWSAVFEDVGEWAIETEAPGEVRLLLERLPGACVEDETWARSVANSLSALQARIGVAGCTELVSLDPTAAVARYAVRWGVEPG